MTTEGGGAGMASPATGLTSKTFASELQPNEAGNLLQRNARANDGRNEERPREVRRLAP